MEKCQRCNTNEAIFACMECESFRSLCDKCDKYIHSLRGKKDHSRVAMTSQGEDMLNIQQKEKLFIKNNNNTNNININSQENNSENSFTNKNQVIESNKIKYNMKIIQPESNMIQQKRNIYQYNTNAIQPETNVDQYNVNPIQPESNMIQHESNALQPEDNTIPKESNVSFIQPEPNMFQKENKQEDIKNTSIDNKTQPFSYSSIYSKDYLNELKNTYEKDKLDYENQGSSLLTSIEKIKLSFTDQINKIKKQIEDYELIKANISQKLEFRYNNKILNLKEDYKREAFLLTEKISQLEKQNEVLNKELASQAEESRRKLIDYERVNKQLQNEILKKDEQIYILKSQLESIVSHNQNMIENETHRLSSHYENKIKTILNETDHSREQLIKIINDRENDIKTLVNTNKENSNDLMNTVRKLKEENEMINSELISVKGEREQLEKSLFMLSENQSEISKPTNIRKDQIKGKLENENKKLKAQNVRI